MRNKEMVYSEEHKQQFIALGLYDGFRYYVKNNGTHPCCYVSIPADYSIDFEQQREYLENTISCHGGLTYFEKVLWDPENELYIPGNFIGWDYAHACDYVSGEYGHDGLHYSTEFLIDECFDVIEQLREIERWIENPKDIRVIAIDFDGVICTNNYPNIGEPNWAIINAALAEKDTGSKLILWTCRCDDDLEKAVEACEEWGLEFDKINDNIEELKLRYNNNTRKVWATEYWDDHNTLVKDIVKKRYLSTVEENE